MKQFIKNIQKKWSKPEQPSFIITIDITQNDAIILHSAGIEPSCYDWALITKTIRPDLYKELLKYNHNMVKPLAAYQIRIRVYYDECDKDEIMLLKLTWGGK